MLAPQHIVGFVEERVPRAIDRPVPLAGMEGEHEVDRVFRLARAFGVEGSPPPLRIAVDSTQAGRVQAATSLPMASRGRPSASI